jgi:hypothetical protein
VRLSLKVTRVVACAGVLAACSSAAPQQSASIIAGIFDSKLAAQQNYERALADYQNCYAANPKNADACEHQRQVMEADVKLLTAALGSSR